MAKQSAPLHGSVSEDFIEKVADMEYRDDEGQVINLRDEEGNPKLNLILYILGFYWYHGQSQAEAEAGEKEREEGAVFERLTQDTRYHRNYKSETVYVRNVHKPYEVKNMKVYTGYIRPNYPYKRLYASGQILVGDFIHGGAIKNILDIGDEDSYRKARYHAVSMRQLDDRWDFSSEE